MKTLEIKIADELVEQVLHLLKKIPREKIEIREATHNAALNGIPGSVANLALQWPRPPFGDILSERRVPMISFKGRWFEKETILINVRWYLAYPLSLSEPGGDDGRTGRSS